MDGAQGDLEQQLVRPQTVRAVNRTGDVARAARPGHTSAERPRPDGGIRAASSCSTGSADSPTAAANTSSTSSSGGARCRRPRGRTSSRSRHFGFAASELGPGFTWSREQPRQPADAVAERSGQRSARRSRCSFATTRPAAFWSATPLPAGDGLPYTVRHGAGIHRLRARARRHRVGADPFVPPDDAGQGVHADAAQYLGPRRDVCRSRSTSIGCSARTARAPQLHVVTDREPATGAVTAHERVPPGVRGPRGVPRSLSAASAHRHRRSHGVHRPQRLAAIAGGARRRRAVGPRRARRSIRAARCRSRSTLDASSEHALVGLLGEARDVAGVARAGRALSRGLVPPTRPCSRRAAFWNDLLGTVQVQDARSRRWT